MSRFRWTRPEPELFRTRCYEVCTLNNGEVAGAIARTPDDRWTVSPGCRSFSFRADAVRAVEKDAKARLWFLDRTGDA